MAMTSPEFASGVPKYVAIARHYEQAIAAGVLLAGDRLPPERDLAAQWAITPMTVRHALSVLQDKQLIVRRQGQGTFVSASPVAVKASASVTRRICVLGIHPPPSRDARQVNWQPSLRRFEGMVDAAFRHGVVLGSSLDHLVMSEPRQALAKLREADGLVLHDELLAEPVLAELAEAGMPMVAINCYPQVDYCSRLLVDSRRGAFAAVRHLAELGHTRIGLIVGNPRHYSMGLRLAGYRDAHAVLNLPVRDAYIVEESRGLEEDGVEACRQLLSLPDRPTAIFAVSDRRALGIVERARELGVSIPRELSVIGFDDLAEAACSDPPLTTLHNPLYESGVQAIEMLLRVIEGKARPGTLDLLPARLVERETTAPPPH